MIETLFSRFQRWRPQPDEDALPHAWTHEDSNWHASSLDLARGLDVTEVAFAGFGDRPRTPPVFHDTAAGGSRGTAMISSPSDRS